MSTPVKARIRLFATKKGSDKIKDTSAYVSTTSKVVADKKEAELKSEGYTVVRNTYPSGK